MKKTVIALFAALSCLGSAATVSLGGAPTGRLAVALPGTSTLLSGANSFYITAGTYTSAPTDAATALSGFVPLVTVSSSVVTVGAVANGVNPSVLGGSFVGVGPATLNSAAVYFLVSDTATYSAATQVAVVRAATQLFPNPVSGSGSVSVTSSLVGLTEVVGTKVDAPTGFDYVQLVAVPEPSAALLGMLGALGLLRRRR